MGCKARYEQSRNFPDIGAFGAVRQDRKGAVLDRLPCRKAERAPANKQEFESYLPAAFCQLTITFNGCSDASPVLKLTRNRFPSGLTSYWWSKELRKPGS